MNLLLLFRLPSPVQAERKNEIYKFSRTLTTQFRTLIMAHQPMEFPRKILMKPRKQASATLSVLLRVSHCQVSIVCRVVYGNYRSYHARLYVRSGCIYERRHHAHALSPLSGSGLRSKRHPRRSSIVHT